MSEDIQRPDGPITIDAEQVAAVRQEIHAAILAAEDGETLLDRVLKALGELVDFDLAVVVRYSPAGPTPDSAERAWSARPIHFYWPNGADEAKWPQKWFPVKRTLLDGLRQALPEGRCFGDIEKDFLQLADAEQLRDDLTIQYVVKQGYRSFMVLLLHLDGQCPFQLNLLKKCKSFYTGEDFGRLSELALGLDLAVSVACRMMDAKSKRAAWHLLEELHGEDHSPAESYAQRLAKRVVDKLFETYGWERVSIFKVDHRSKSFQPLEHRSAATVAQRVASHTASNPLSADTIVAATFKQNSRDGEDGQTDLVWNKDERYSAHLRPIWDDSASALCKPIRSEGEIIWLLNLEDSRKSVFVDYERTLILPPIVQAIEIFFSNFYSSSVRSAIFMVATRGVVITDLEDDVHIIDINPAAERLLGLKSADVNGKLFRELLATGDSSEHLLAYDHYDRREVAIFCNGEARPMLLSCRQLPIEAGRRVFFIDDPAPLTEHAALREFHNAAQLLIAESAPFLAMAIAQVETLIPTVSHHERAQLQRVKRLLEKAWIDHSRVVLAAPDRKAAAARITNVDLPSLLQSEIDANFFENKDTRFRVTLTKNGKFTAKGDRLYLRIAIQLILNYFDLMFSGENEKVWISFEPGESAKTFTVTVSGNCESGAPARFASMRSADRAEQVLNEAYLRTIIEGMHDGRLQVNRLSNKVYLVKITLHCLASGNA